MESLKLTYGKGSKNAKLAALEAKLGGKVYTFSILSGHNCPYAKECLAKANPHGKIIDGPNQRFRCFSASQEQFLPNIRESRRKNSAIVQLAAVSVSLAADALIASMPKNAACVRIHVAGDFATQAYFDAWLEVARRMSHVRFYAYTKSLPFWVKRIGVIPQNLVLTASYGGHRDELIAQHGLRSARVVFSKSEARQLGLKIDNDDSRAMKNGPSFALLLHGTQRAGTHAAKVWDKLRRKGSKYSGRKTAGSNLH